MFKGNKLLLLLAPLIIAVCALGYYFLYWCQSPVYAVNEVRSSIANHDVEKFEKYVDLPHLIDKAFEDIIVAESKINNDNITANPFAMGILHMLKPTVVNLLVEEAKAEIASTAKNKEDAVKKQDPIADAMKKNIENKVYLNKMKLNDIDLEEADGDKAVVKLTLTHKETNEDFDLKLKMLLNEDDVWQIKEITNLVDFILEVNAAEQELMASANKPILEKLSNSIEITDKEISIKEKGSRQILSVLLTAENTTEKTISKIYYDINIYDDKDNLIYSYTEHFNSSIPPHSSQLINNNKILKKTLPADNMLMKTDLDDIEWEIKVTYIGFEDGEIISSNQF